MEVFTNPVIKGFYPDASVCRKGDDYYLICTTQEFFPALPVFHSRNLADWEQIGHVVSDPAKLNLDYSEDGQGVTAPTLRYYDGTFYAVSTLIRHDPGDQWFIKSFVCTAEDPAGPWSEPIFIEGAEGIDPSLFKDDDGKVYYHGNDWVRPAKTEGHRVIWAQEFDPAEMKLIGERTVLLDAVDWVDTYGEDGCVSFDGPHIYKKDGWYYLIIAAGDTHWNHSMMAFRSNEVYGPYEPCPDNPIMTHRNQDQDKAAFACVGHIDIIKGPDGRDWGVFLGTRPHAGCYNYLGREVFLAPVDWTGEWPVIGNGKEIEKQYPKPQLPVDSGQLTVDKNGKDGFDTEALGLEYLFIRRPKGQWWKTGDGKLEISLREPMLHEVANPSFIGKRLTDLDFSAETTVDFTADKENEEAGLVLYKSTMVYFRLVVRQTAEGRKPTADNGRREIVLVKRLTGEDADTVAASAGSPEGPLELRIDTVNECCRFSWRKPGGDWDVLDDTNSVSCLAQTVTGGFTGILVGMFAGSNGIPSDNSASFRNFLYSGKDTD